MPERGHAKLPELASKVFHKFNFLSKKEKLACCFGVDSSDFLTESLTIIELLRNWDSMNCLLFNSVDYRDYLILILEKNCKAFTM